MFGILNPPKSEVLHHWCSTADGFHTSPSEFYDGIEHELVARKIPGLEISRVEYTEGGLLSAKREYLRLMRERLTVDICAAPFGTGFFFSSRTAELPLVTKPWEIGGLFIGLFLAFWLLCRLFGTIWGTIAFVVMIFSGLWFMRNAIALGLKDIDSTLLKAPIIGTFYKKYLRKETYYRQDTRLMYLQIVPAIVKHMAEQVTAAKGVKLSKQYEQKPILGDLYKPVFSPLESGRASDT